MRTGLLISVRSVEEAVLALEGGADLIDVKEPSAGSLGAAPRSVISEIVDRMAGRVPVSAAMGELTEWEGGEIDPRLSFVKWGLRGADHRKLLAVRNLQTVVVIYADWQRTNSPSPDDLLNFAITERFGVVLIDTGQKDGSRLTDFVPISVLCEWRKRLSEADISFALAGSLQECDIAELATVAPRWFAVRGAACVQNQRESRIDIERVRSLKRLISGFDSP